MKVKLCGFTDMKPLEFAIAKQCDFIGFVFCKNSVRYISPKEAGKISKIIPKNIKKVAVVVDENFDVLKEIADEISPDFFQFHGSETAEFLKEFRKKFPQIGIIKAFRIENADDVNQTKSFEDFADYFLFDGKIAGSGNSFDWSILKNYRGSKSWFLSGGINANNIVEALRITGAFMIDVSSGIEKTRGQKSPELIAELMTEVRKIQNN
jgi:phosphoribosylanthranilate isomerase